MLAAGVEANGAHALRSGRPLLALCARLRTDRPSVAGDSTAAQPQRNRRTWSLPCAGTHATRLPLASVGLILYFHTDRRSGL